MTVVQNYQSANKSIRHHEIYGSPDLGDRGWFYVEGVFYQARPYYSLQELIETLTRLIQTGVFDDLP